MTDNKIKQVLLYLPDQVHEVLKNICEIFGLTVNGYIKSIVLDYLSSNNFIENLELKNGVLIKRNSWLIKNGKNKNR